MTSRNLLSKTRFTGKSLLWEKIAVAAILLCCGTLVVVPVGAAAKEKPPFPDVRIKGFAHNEQAIRALGDRLPAVAAWYGKRPDELSALFRRDRTLWVGPKGRLLHICELEAPIGAESGVEAGPVIVPPGPYPLEQTFKLHSSPGSNRVLYLDFNGHMVSGTAWNSGANINAAPFDLDGSPSTFNTTELERIQNIWKRVAEDYSPFDVDITTEEPPPDALTRTSSGDTHYGIRVVITPTNFYANAGGVSYVGAFDDVGEYYKTSWVFSNMLANGEKYIAEACSHESGHALGLSHDGKTDGTVYYQGQGNWAPIMGNSYYKTVTQWSKGEYTGANNTQDDLAVMQNYGLTIYPDDHGNTAAAATLVAGATSISGSGFIERNTDVDVFQFLTGAGNIAISVIPAPVGPDLDLQAELRDSNWNLVAVSSPPELGASISATVPAGTYYLAISGTGSGDPASTGYSRYASLGQYTFTGTIVDAGPLKPPVAVASATPVSGNAPLPVTFFSTGSADTGGAITGYSWDFGDGSKSSEPNPSHIYLIAGSFVATLTVTDNDNLTGSASVPVAVRNDLFLNSISLTPQSSPTAVSVSGTVVVVSVAGNLVAGATVTGNWGGVVSGSASGVTGSDGTASFASPQSSKSGTFTLSVTGVSAPGYTYNPGLNRQSSASVTANLAQDPFAAPSNLQASSIKSQVTLRWKDNSIEEGGFYVERSPRGGASFVIIATLGQNAVNYLDSGLTKGTFYDYRVRAFKTVPAMVSTPIATAYSNTVTIRVK